MKREYRLALAIGGVGLAGIIAYAATGLYSGALILIAAPAAPLAVLCMVWGRIGRRFPLRALLLGLVIGPAVALLAHPAVAGFMVAFVSGFGTSGQHLVEALRIDPRLTTALASPWILVLLVDLITVAPLTEEFGKALGAVAARPQSRQDAFLFGAAAGAGFAVIENFLYVGTATAAGDLWPVVALSRVVGAAVHPLASGLVMIGWWEWRHDRRVRRLLRGYFSGAGIHALWNGTLVVIGMVVSTALATSETAGASLPIAFTFGALLGAIMLIVLWWVSGSVAKERQLATFRFGSARSLAALVIVGASLLIPLAVLVITFPHFYRG
jgi:RsiW-degrading membrane proteinase PrsW (M82 family)